jgi:hypothetical protein
MNKIICVGCSHASISFTRNPWPYWISQYFNASVEILSSPGAGIQIGVDKLSLALETNDVDFVVFQVPHNVRLSIGMNYHFNPSDPQDQQRWQLNGNQVAEEFIMGLNPNNNINAMSRLHGEKYRKMFLRFNDWYLQFVGDNRYETDIRFLQNIFMVQEMCRLKNVPYVFFLWHDFKTDTSDRPLFKSWLDKIDFSRCPDKSIEQFLVEQKIKAPWNINRPDPVDSAYSVDGYHLNDNGSKKIIYDFIAPFIESKS